MMAPLPGLWGAWPGWPPGSASGYNMVTSMGVVTTTDTVGRYLSLNRGLLVAAGLRLMLMGVPSYRWILERSSAEQVGGN